MDSEFELNEDGTVNVTKINWNSMNSKEKRRVKDKIAKINTAAKAAKEETVE